MPRRWEAFEPLRASLKEAIPTEKHAEFDRFVEQGGYGFKNVVLKGMPLAFGLGGKPGKPIGGESSEE